MITNYNDVNENITDNKYKKLWIAFVVIIACCFAVFSWQASKLYQLEQKLNATRKVYVYDLQETLRGLKIDEINAQFEAKVNILNHEVLTAQNKISSLKDANVQADFSDVYLNSLKNKRDDMIKEYNDTLQKITNQINDNLAQIAQEYNTPTIFDKKIISAFTPNVIDVTPDVIQRIQLDNVYNMLK